MRTRAKWLSYIKKDVPPTPLPAHYRHLETFFFFCSSGADMARELSSKRRGQKEMPVGSTSPRFTSLHVVSRWRHACRRPGRRRFLHERMVAHKILDHWRTYAVCRHGARLQALDADEALTRLQRRQAVRR